MNLDNVIAVRSNKKIYRDGNLTIKLFNEDFSKADILNEALNQARAEETDLNVPKILEVAKIDGKWAIISEYIEGKTLKQLALADGNKMDEYMNLFVDLQMEMHSKRVPSLNKLKDKMMRKIGESNFDDTIKYELCTRLEGMPKHTKLCHGDYNPSNIVIANDGTPFLIDWAHATQGNASADVARTYLLFRLAEDIENAERYLDMFCEKSNTQKHYVLKWLPIVAASQSVKGREKEREFLSNWVNVVEYE